MHTYGTQKHVLMNLFAGEQKFRHRGQIYGHSRWRRWWGIRVSLKYIITMCVHVSEKLLYEHGELNQCWQPREVGWGGGGQEERVHMYTYDWFMSLYERNQHTVKKVSKQKYIFRNVHQKNHKCSSTVLPNDGGGGASSYWLTIITGDHFEVSGGRVSRSMMMQRLKGRTLETRLCEDYRGYLVLSVPPLLRT